MDHTSRCAWLPRLAAIGSILLAATAAAAPATVWTYHYDNLRTGWDRNETTLSAKSFPSNFGVLATVTLDDQVDAQPLLVPGLTVNGAVHDVLYTVTANNTLYALDAATGAVLLSRNFGSPVHQPLGCGNNGPNVGISSTPVISIPRQTLYLIAYIQGSGGPQYELHEVSLTTLADATPARVIAAAHALTDGTTFNFNATYQRQRPGLLLQKGVVYAGFGSFCDFQANHSRGWVLGWNAAKLAPLAGVELNDTQATSPTSFFLSSVWMSGSALATNGSSIFFSTGNSDCNFYKNPEDCPSQTTYDGVTNLQESVVSLDPTLTTRTGVFTPSNVYQMDVDDADLGAAGVLLLPTQPDGSNLAAIVSKDGRLFLLDQANLSTPIATYQLGNGCWCAPSYYRGADGVGRIVTSAGALQTWKVVTTPAPHLVSESSTATVPVGIQDPGFFTAVSSNHIVAGSAIIWAVGRPTDGNAPGLTLYAFSATPSGGTLPLLYSGAAGSWPNTGGNANVVPLVANGRVYVGAYKSLTIYGAGGTAAVASAMVKQSPQLPAGTRRVTGTLLALQGSQATLLTRDARQVQVDVAPAAANQRSTALTVGQAYTVIAPESAAGDAAGWRASAVMRAKSAAAAWPEDQ